jgi:hypothetical protein
MCLGVYESFVNLNPFHVDHFLHTADLEGAAWWLASDLGKMFGGF